MASCGCGNNCTSYCGGNTCKGSCGGSCLGGCKNSGKNVTGTYNPCSCGNNCEGPCAGGCKTSSKGSTSSSGSSCTTCGTACNKACSANCTGSCKSGCSGSCTETCTGGCTGSCNTECNSGCLSTEDMMAYRKLKLTEYINSANITIIYKFIEKQLKRLGADMTGFPTAEAFAQEEYAQEEVMSRLIKIMNDAKSPDTQTEIFSKDNKIPELGSEETIYNKLGVQIIDNAKILFNTKIGVE